MPKCPSCKYVWRNLADEIPTECPSCGFTGHEHDEDEPDEVDEDPEPDITELDGPLYQPEED